MKMKKKTKKMMIILTVILILLIILGIIIFISNWNFTGNASWYKPSTWAPSSWFNPFSSQMPNCKYNGEKIESGKGILWSCVGTAGNLLEYDFCGINGKVQQIYYDCRKLGYDGCFNAYTDTGGKFPVAHCGLTKDHI